MNALIGAAAVGIATMAAAALSMNEVLLGEPEVIGAPDCPLFHRWTLFTFERGGEVKLKVMRRFGMRCEDDGS